MDAYIEEGKEDIPGGGRLGGFDLPEELIEHPNEIVVIRTPKDFGNKCSAFVQKVHGKFETHEDELRLAVRVLDPGCSDIGGTVVQHNICAPVF